MRREIIAIFSLAFALMYILWPLDAHATSYNSLINGDWDNSSTWHPTGVPSTGDDATIANSNQISILPADGSVSAADVNFASNGTLSMSAGTQIIGDITATGAGTTGTGTVSIVSATGGSSTNIVGPIA